MAASPDVYVLCDLCREHDVVCTIEDFLDKDVPLICNECKASVAEDDDADA